MMRPALRTALLATAVAASLSAARAQQDAGSGELLVQCKRLFVTADTAVEPGEFLVRNGKVAGLGQVPDHCRRASCSRTRRSRSNANSRSARWR